MIGGRRQRYFRLNRHRAAAVGGLGHGLAYRLVPVG
jgi:hypothetical protein